MRAMDLGMIVFRRDYPRIVCHTFIRSAGSVPRFFSGFTR